MSLPVSRTVSLPTPPFSAALLADTLEVYRASSAALTWAGSAAYLGVSRVMLDACLAGQISSSEAADIQEILALHRTHIEGYLEGILTREKGSPAGAQFALKAQHGWEDKVTLELSQKPQLVINVDGELGRLLLNRDGDIEDGEIIEDEDDSWLG